MQEGSGTRSALSPQRFFRIFRSCVTPPGREGRAASRLPNIFCRGWAFFVKHFIPSKQRMGLEQHQPSDHPLVPIPPSPSDKGARLLRDEGERLQCDRLPDYKWRWRSISFAANICTINYQVVRRKALSIHFLLRCAMHKESNNLSPASFLQSHLHKTNAP